MGSVWKKAVGVSDCQNPLCLPGSRKDDLTLDTAVGKRFFTQNVQASSKRLRRQGGAYVRWGCKDNSIYLVGHFSEATNNLGHLKPFR